MRLRLFALFLLGSFLASAQQHPAFWNDIQAFKKQDSINAPKPGQILLIGSSSFTRWTDVNSYFPGYQIVNRGFGGSTLVDLIRYANDIVPPYRPKQILIYCGENDFAADPSLPVETVVNRFIQLFNIIRQYDKNVPVVFVSMKPSPSRANLMPKYVQANAAIKKFLEGQKQTDYIDVYTKMLKPDGQPMDDIFVEDRLHMTAKGYAIWKKEIEPHLLK